MAEDSGSDKTEPASSRRIERAREEGDVPRSRELGTCLLLMSAGVAMWVSGGELVNKIGVMLTSSMHFERAAAFDLDRLLDLQLSQILQLLIALLPLAGVLIVVALISPALIGGWLFSVQALTPNFERLNPLPGLARMFSVRALVELVKALGKSAVVGIIAYKVMMYHSEAITGLVSEPSKEGLQHVAQLLLICFISISSGLIVIMAIDVPFQLRSYANKLKMTMQEVKQESKEANGNPQIKGKIRQQQREMARRRMMSKVPTADVVVTNPSHYAVALRYVEGRMSAPVVVAKGMDLVAARIREIAAEHNIPLLEAPPLARALYTHAELNIQIPEALYTAVAEVLAYVFQLRSFKENGGLTPQKPSEIDVPEELDPISAAALNAKKSKIAEHDSGEALNG
ncbi:flagellar biosynthetic protein FlhB [Oxalobacteraceae bacterium GrIS 2.11]